jgi:hypothetical protein
MSMPIWFVTRMSVSSNRDADRGNYLREEEIERLFSLISSVRDHAIFREAYELQLA